VKTTILLCLILLSSICLAHQINYYVPTTVVQGDGSSMTKISVTLEIPSDEPFHISVFDSNTDSLKTEANFPNFSCDVEENLYGANLVCDVSGSTNNTRSFEIEFKNKGIITQDGSARLLEQEFTVPYPSKNIVAKIVLPEGMVIQADQLYLPEFGTTSSDGRKLEIIWRKENASSGEHIPIKVPYEPLPLALPLELIILLVFLVAVVLYLLNKRRQSPLIMPILKSDEKSVMKGVLNHGDGVNQKILVRESGYSKAKVSKVLKSLQERGIITLERIGRGNKVYINKNIGKDAQNDSGNN